jgi:hypothetical protein
MRTYILYGALALGGCAAPEQAFPHLAALPTPEAPATTAAQRQADMDSLQARGAATREAGRMVRAGEDLKADLPK